MNHFTHPRFWEYYHKLPKTIQDLADKNFELLKTNPNHSSLHFKKVGNFWSVRVGRKYRALAVRKENNLVWFWIGSHSEYDKLT